MTTLRRSRTTLGVALVAAAAAVVVLAPIGALATTDPVPVPPEYRDPSPELIAASIRVWDPSGHVTAIETETTVGGEAVVSLDSDILFAFGRADLSDAAKARIEALAIDIPPGAVVSVTGHTDDIGSEADNLVLSQMRAEAVAAVIVGQRGELIVEEAGRGEAEPVAPNTDAEGREANRRVEIRYQV